MKKLFLLKRLFAYGLLFFCSFTSSKIARAQFNFIQQEYRDITLKDPIVERFKKKYICNYQIHELIKTDSFYYFTLINRPVYRNKFLEKEIQTEGGLLMKVDRNFNMVSQVNLPSTYFEHPIHHQSLIHRGKDSFAVIFSKYNRSKNIHYFFFRHINNMQLSDSIYLLDQIDHVPDGYEGMNGIVADYNHRNFVLHYMDVNKKEEKLNLAVKMYNPGFEVIAADHEFLTFDSSLSNIHFLFNRKGTFFVINQSRNVENPKIYSVFSISKFGTYLYNNDTMTSGGHMVDIDQFGYCHLLVPQSISAYEASFKWIILDADSGTYLKSEIVNLYSKIKSDTTFRNLSDDYSVINNSNDKYKLDSSNLSKFDLTAAKQRNDDSVRLLNIRLRKFTKPAFKGERAHGNFSKKLEIVSIKNYSKIRFDSARFDFHPMDTSKLHLIAEKFSVKVTKTAYWVSYGKVHYYWPTIHSLGPAHVYLVSSDTVILLNSVLDVYTKSLSRISGINYLATIRNTEVLLVKDTGIFLYHLSNHTINKTNDFMLFNKELEQGRFFYLPNGILVLDAIEENKFGIKGFVEN